MPDPPFDHCICIFDHFICFSEFFTAIEVKAGCWLKSNKKQQVDNPKAANAALLPLFPYQ
jgi:hypothetical protein